MVERNDKINFKKIVILPLFFSLIFFSFNKGTNKNEQKLLAKSNFLNLKYPAEKIYIHLDRPSYFVGEDVWFKAYLKNSPIPNCNLYIELVNASGEIVDKKINWAQNGLAYGDFHLDKSLSTGIYQIRAYTNWMRNFDESWFFRKDILIWNRRDRKIETETTELRQKDVNIQFFPEGGTMLAGVKNKVAFKGTDKNGKGIFVEGEIIDEFGNSVSNFKSDFKGIGSFVFIPVSNMNYKAKVNIAEKFKLTAELPETQINNLKLSIEPNNGNKIDIQISDGGFNDEENTEKNYFLVGQSNGQIIYQKRITQKIKTSRIEIEKEIFPTGIVKFTLFDNHFIPRCERLIFVNHNDFIGVEINPDKSEYLTRENVNFNIKTLDKEGVPFLSNLSMSVYNTESSIETEKYTNNILTQFLLKSELKGIIEDPAWYFKDNEQSTLQALDNLLLTHGYRYFEWKEIIENRAPELNYQPEASVQLKGKVTNWFSKKPAKDVKVTMMSVKSLLAVYEETTDSAGNFIFSDLFVNDTVIVSLQAGDRRDRRNYWIELDNRTWQSPETKFVPSNYRYQNNVQYTTSWYLSEINSDLKNTKWHLNDTILLGDINIVSSKREVDDGHSRPYLDADYVLDVSKHDNIYTDVFEMLENISPYMRNFMMQNPTYYLDGVPASAEFVDLPPSWFDKVEAVRMAPQSGGFGPALYFYTNRGETQTKDFDGLGTKAGKIVGYSVIRKFYSPVYETRNPENSENDFRNTLYWNPIVRTDSTGIARVSYYNSDEAGTMQVVIEGITSDGKLCRGTASYQVKN